ncbi:MAG TPA: hypothetical protein VIU63_07045 [Nitrospira sp.]|jgi:dihydrolipoamide dehydrogenase
MPNHIVILGAGPGGYVTAIRAAKPIHEAAPGMEIGATVTKMADMIHAHPAMSEDITEAEEDAAERAVHQLRKRSG